MRQTVSAVVIAALATACGAAPGDAAVGGVATSADHVLSVEERGLLDFVNDREHTTLVRLDDGCGIRSDSAKHIIRYRDGRDRAPFTDDDNLFDTVAELDSVSMVGAWTIERLEVCARAYGYVNVEGWSTLLDVAQLGASQPAVAAHDDGRVAVFHGAFQSTPSGNLPVSVFRSYSDGAWSAVRLDPGMPDYESSYGPGVKGLFGHHLVAVPSSAGTGVDWVAGVVGRYSTSRLDDEGPLYALFLRAHRRGVWSEWQRVTPVGRLSAAAVEADAAGTIHFAWSDADNLTPGSVQLASFDPATSAVGGRVEVGAASQQLGFQSLDLSVSDAGAVWVTWRAPGGLEAREREADGSLGTSWELSTSGGWIPGHDAAWADGTLWVVTDAPGLPVYRLGAKGFELDADDLFEGYGRETDTELEDLTYANPLLLARPEGGIAVAAARIWHYEHFDGVRPDADVQSTVIRERSGAAGWRPETVVFEDGTWNNTGGSGASSAAGLYVSGAALVGDASVFVAGRGAPD